MKFSALSTLCPMLFALCAAAQAGTAGKTLVIDGKTLTLAAPAKCGTAHRPVQELAKYLRQYDPARDPKNDIDDETPRTKEEVRLIRNGLVENGFHYPNGQESVITWMDADGDGICDFTASAGIGGTHAIDRMFLFRGLSNGDFQMAASDLTYMEGSIELVPYIPISVAGDKLPLLAANGTLMQWQAARKQFVTCDAITYGPDAAQARIGAPLLATLCGQQGRIYAWAADQLPHRNAIPH